MTTTPDVLPQPAGLPVPMKNTPCGIKSERCAPRGPRTDDALQGNSLVYRLCKTIVPDVVLCDLTCHTLQPRPGALFKSRRTCPFGLIKPGPDTASVRHTPFDHQVVKLVGAQISSKCLRPGSIRGDLPSGRVDSPGWLCLHSGYVSSCRHEVRNCRHEDQSCRHEVRSNPHGLQQEKLLA